MRDCLLNHPVHGGGDSQLAHFPVVLGYLNPADREWPVPATENVAHDFSTMEFQVRQKFIHRHPVHSAAPPVPYHPFVGVVQVEGIDDVLQRSHSLVCRR